LLAWRCSRASIEQNAVSGGENIPILANARQRLFPRKHDLLTHPFTPPIHPSLPAIAAGVLGGSTPDSLQFTPDMCSPPFRGGPHCSSFMKGRSCVLYFSQSGWVTDGLLCGCMLSPWTLLYTTTQQPVPLDTSLVFRAVPDGDGGS
jgi:hypothetical protein